MHIYLASLAVAHIKFLCVSLQHLVVSHNQKVSEGDGALARIMLGGREENSGGCRLKGQLLGGLPLMGSAFKDEVLGCPSCY